MLQTKVRTTVYLPKSLLETAKLMALNRNMTFTALVQEGLKKEIRTRETKKNKHILKFYNLGNPEYVFKRADAYE